MLIDIVSIAFLCILMGIASIPLSFNINSSPVVVWFGNALGSLISALVVIYLINNLKNKKSHKRIYKSRIGKKIVNVIENNQGSDNVKDVNKFINKFGLRLFALFCPLFPGVLISTIVVYLLNLDKKTYLHWMSAGVIFISGIYVFGYWWIFIK